MASESEELRLKSVLEASQDSTLNAAKDQSENFDRSAIFEPSEDTPLFRRERPTGTYRATTIIVQSPDEEEDGQQTGRRRSVCIDIFNGYKNFTMKFRNSKLIFILQMLLAMLPVSTFVMGAKYSQSCPGSSDLTFLSVVNGMFGTILIGLWICNKFCRSDDEQCDNRIKFFILTFFIFVAALLELEIYFFIKFSPSFKPNTVHYCHKTFYDFTYYKFIAAFTSMFGVILLYIPDYQSLASGVTWPDTAFGCYGAMIEQ